MQTLKTAIDNMTKDCYFCTIDLQEAFFSIPVCKRDRKYFRFFWHREKLQFTSLTMEYGSSPPRIYKTHETGFCETQRRRLYQLYLHGRFMFTRLN